MARDTVACTRETSQLVASRPMTAPWSAQEWVDRNAQIADFVNRAQGGFKDIATNLK
jgi:hypothetical protein